MASCAHCHSRKGKRACPALGRPICTPCCGEYRLVEIRCPDDCVHLKSHEDYQRRRTLHRVPPAWTDRIVLYEQKPQRTQLALHEIHIAVCRFDAEKMRLDLPAAREGIEFARRRMSLIETHEPFVPPFGDYLVRHLDELIESRALVERDGIREVLEETLRHLDAEVSLAGFADFLGFLRALYADHLGPAGARAPGGPSLILPGG